MLLVVDVPVVLFNIPLFLMVQTVRRTIEIPKLPLFAGRAGQCAALGQDW